MIGRIRTAYVVEIKKLVHRKFSIVGLLFVLMAVAAAAVIRPLVGGEAYEFIAYAVSVSVNLLGLFLLLTFCASLVSGEISGGSICAILVRPVRRHELLIAKILLGLTYAIVLIGAAGAAAWALALSTGNLTGVSFGGEVLFTNTEMASAFLIGMALSIAPYFAAVAFAVFISTAVRSVAAAIGATLGIWILLDLVKHPMRLGKFWFSTYIETPWQVFAGRCGGMDASWWPDIAWALGVSAVWGALFSALAILVLSKRNLRA